MTLTDCVAFAAFTSFGLWWLIFPDSVIRFYSWFGPAVPKNPVIIRLAGLAWTMVMICAFIWFCFSPQRD